MRIRGVAAIAISILNATELDEAVAVCAQHVEEALGQQFDTHHCSVTDQVDSMLSRTEEVYDHLSLPVMELVTNALKHDDWSARLKSILDPLETVEFSDEEEEVGGDGDSDGDGDGYEYVVVFVGRCLVNFLVFNLCNRCAVALFEWTILCLLIILVKLQLLHCCYKLCLC
ncbi:hypothetical protein Hanom_Chr06g00527131 [Helianthus anomalus]